jgi:tRNA(fMet)-specific endonuclease VapC
MTRSPPPSFASKNSLAEIKASRGPDAAIQAYSRYHEHVELSARWVILPWDKESSDLFFKHRKDGIRIPTLDLRIACIAMAHEALLLTRNLVDFSQVPGLNVQNWLD